MCNPPQRPSRWWRWPRVCPAPWTHSPSCCRSRCRWRCRRSSRWRRPPCWRRCQVGRCPGPRRWWPWSRPSGRLGARWKCFSLFLKKCFFWVFFTEMFQFFYIFLAWRLGFSLSTLSFSTLLHIMILQHIRIIGGDAGFEPGTSAIEVLCATNEPPHVVLFIFKPTNCEIANISSLHYLSLIIYTISLIALYYKVINWIVETLYFSTA